MASRPKSEAPGDDDALNWGGETDPSHVDGPAADAKSPAVATSRGPVATADGGPELEPRTSSFLLVTYGILAGAYLLYVIGWIVAVGRSTVTLPNILGEIMYQFGEFLAIASPLIWFAAVFILTRDSKAIVRLLWLIAGLVVLVPWPFILGGA